MHNQFANGFYGSQQWKNCRRAFRNAKGGLCEACLAKGLITPGAEVHHKIPLTPENMTDPRVTLDWSNLELLCKSCHDARHEHEIALTRTDPTGHVEL